MLSPFVKAEQERLQEELTEAAAMAAMPPPAAAAQPKEDDQLRMSQDDDEGEEGAKPDDPLVVHKCLEIIFQLMQESSECMSHLIWYHESHDEIDESVCA